MQVLSARVLRPIGEDDNGDAILVEMFGGGVGDWAEVEVAFEIEMKRASRAVLFKVVIPLIGISLLTMKAAMLATETRVQARTCDACTNH